MYFPRFYDEEQQTYVVLFDDPPQHLKNNPLAIAANCVEGITTKRHKLKYNPEEVTIEWKIKAKKDAKENYCEAGQNVKNQASISHQSGTNQVADW
ncbi:hypothetical protein C1646_761275 [Rhizophagus diaphanus]|nr:hypothetical protein C1646_761275 [Rhizophagus diaphanus] [Rhizophagus sp. MUCL 43196]